MSQPTQVRLAPGENEIPQYNPRVWTGGNLRIVATTSPLQGTIPNEPQDPNASTVAFRMDWKDAIRLAVMISEMAEMRGERLPPGVLYRGSMH